MHTKIVVRTRSDKEKTVVEKGLYDGEDAGQKKNIAYKDCGEDASRKKGIKKVA